MIADHGVLFKLMDLDSNTGMGRSLLEEVEKRLTRIKRRIRMKKLQSHGRKRNGLKEQVVTRGGCG
jgi:hypothetical protein